MAPSPGDFCSLRVEKRPRESCTEYILCRLCAALWHLWQLLLLSCLLMPIKRNSAVRSFCFRGGAELLFDGVKKHQVTLPSQPEPCEYPNLLDNL